MLERRRVVDRVALAVVILASVWFAFTAVWGLFGIPAGGHLGAGSTGNVMAAEQMLRWHIFYPAWEWYTGQPPAKGAYICHHPFGQYYIPAFFLAVFGHHDFVARLPGTLLSAPVPLLLYGIAKEKWGRASGAVAAAAYAVLPIAVGFSQFNNLEAYCIFGTLLFFWGHTRHMVTGRKRHLFASLAGLVVACSGDWAGYLLVAPAIIWCFLRAFVLPARLTRRFRFAPYARWWGLSVGIVAGTLLFWLALFTLAGQIDAWVMSALARSGGSAMKLHAVLQGRKDWIDFSFTPLAITLGKIAAPVCLLRLFVTRLDEEAYSLSLLFGATFQYVAFKGGADIHIFWSEYFAPYYALALAQLAHALGAVVAFVVRRVAALLRATPRWQPVAWVTLVTGVLPSVLMTPDGTRSLWIWRRTGGRYDDNGSLTRSHLDLLAVVDQVVLPNTFRGTPIDASPSAEWYWEHTWKYQGIANDVPLPTSNDRGAASHPYWIARPSGLLADAQRKVVAAGHVRAWGDTWLVDQREPVAPIDVYPLEEREPNPWQWLLFEGTEPWRVAGKTPDPWLTWEWRTHLDQAAPEPKGEPDTIDRMRIAHNVAVSRGDVAATNKWRQAIEGQLDRSMAARYDPWASLVGVRRIGGVEPRVEIWFEATAKPAGEAWFQVFSKVEAPDRLSLLPAPSVERKMNWPSSIPTKLWKPGFLYSVQVVLDHRIGRERYTGHWVSRDGSPAPGRPGPDVTLAVVD